jgi:predicted GH43/DUF377 family glycosyl hydrolase
MATVFRPNQEDYIQKLNELWDLALAGGGGSSGIVESITPTAPITVGGTAAVPIIGIQPASAGNAGSMSAANFTKLAGIADGANNYSLPIAGGAVLGGIKVGTGLTIDAQGVLSATVQGSNGGTVTEVAVTAPLQVTNPTTTPALSIPAATAAQHGYMSSGDKGKLDNIAANANNYSLPTATAAILGGIKIGSGLAIDAQGVVNVTAAGGGATINDTATGTTTTWSSTKITAEINALAQTAITTTGNQTLSNKTLLNPAATFQVLTDGATISWDANSGQNAVVELGGNRAIANPTNLKTGAVYTLIVDQDDVGGRTVASWGNVFFLMGDITLNPVAGSRHVFQFIYDGVTMNGGMVFKSTDAPPAPPAEAGAVDDTAIVALFSIGQEGFWFDASDVTKIRREDGSEGSLGAAFKTWNDKSGRGHNMVESLNTSYPLYRTDSAGVSQVYLYDPIEGATGGGAGAAFFMCLAVRPTGWHYNNRVLWSDVDSALPNRGHRIRITAVNQAEFSIGTGSARVTVTATDAEILDTGTFIITVEDDGANIKIQVNNGTIFTQAHVEPALAGSASWRIGFDPNIAVGTPIWDGNIYGIVHRQSTLSATERADVKTWANAVATTPSTYPDPPWPLQSTTFVANPNSGAGFGWGLKVDGDYTYGYLPAAVVTDHAAQSAALQTHYNNWKASAIVDVPGITGGKCVKFGNDATFLTVSEGMGYGMLLAVLFADQTTFNQLLTTVRARPATSIQALTNETGYQLGAYLMNWKLYTNGTGLDGWNAVDGDLDIALALLMADRQWGSAGTWNYAQEGANTIAAMKQWNFKQDGTSQGLGTPHVSRTSDYMYGHFRAFAAHMNDTWWATAPLWKLADNVTDNTEGRGNAISRATYLLERMQTVYSADAGLIPDFVVKTNTPAPIPSPGYMGDGNANEDRYWWNACRIPWRLASDYVWSGDAGVKRVADRLSSYFNAEIIDSGVTQVLGDNQLVANAKWNDPCVFVEGAGWTMFASCGVGFTGEISIYRLVSTDKVTWTLSPSTPVLTKGASGAWDDGAVETPSVVYHGGQFHMFYTGYPAGQQADSTTYRIGHATSPDGATWTKDATFLLGPSGTNLTFNKSIVAEPGAVSTGSEIFLYFTALGEDAGLGTTLQSIGLVKSATGAAGSWTAQAQVLKPDNAVYPRSSFYGFSTPQPCIYSGQLLLMFSIVADPWKQVAIGNALSADGSTAWAMNTFPVVTRNQSWNSAEVLAPCPLQEGAMLHLWFAGNNGTNLGIGYTRLDDYNTKVTAIGTGYLLNGTQAVGGDSPAYMAPIMAGAMIHQQYKALRDKLYDWNASNKTTGYYDGEIQFLSLVVATGNWWTPRG